MASSTEWETDSDDEPQSADDSRPTTPIARVATLRSLSTAPKPLPAIQRRTTRASRPPSSMSTRSVASVHPLLGLHPHISAVSTTTTLTSPPITITSHLPLTATLSHQHHPPTICYDDPQPTPIPIPPYPALSRPRTTSTLSSPSSSAISSLAHIPTRPPSPYTPSLPLPLPHLRRHPSFSAFSTPPSTSNLISFFPPSNPLLSLESIHPLLPAPYLGNHLTVLAKRAPMRECLERVRAAKPRAD